MDTSFAFVVVQLRFAVCPISILGGSTVSVAVGLPGAGVDPGVDWAPPAFPVGGGGIGVCLLHAPANRASATNGARLRLRNELLFMVFTSPPKPDICCC